MIHLTRLNRLPLVLNADLIESIEATPDTVISLTTGQKLVVLEPAAEIVERVIEFRRAISTRLPAGAQAFPEEPGAAGGNPIAHARRNPAGV
jgi:flagellar protein FlbD